MVLPLNLADHKDQQLHTCYRLRELDPNTKNKQINIMSNLERKITVFRSDFSNNQNRTHNQINPLHILNHYRRGLTKIPDYILFYEAKSITYAIIIELKSHQFTGLTDKFSNGGKIARFIHSFYDDNRPLHLVNLLFRLPERALKKPVYYKNNNSITLHDFGYSCTQNLVYFDELIKAMRLQNF